MTSYSFKIDDGFVRSRNKTLLYARMHSLNNDTTHLPQVDVGLRAVVHPSSLTKASVSGKLRSSVVHLDLCLRFFVKRPFQVYKHALRLRPHVRFSVKRYPAIFWYSVSTLKKTHLYRCEHRGHQFARFFGF